MARPTYTSITSWEGSWDAAVNANFDVIFLTPFPIPIYAGSGAFPAAADYENCLIADSNNDGEMYISDGTSWIPVPHQVTAEADLTDNSTGSSGSGTIGAVTTVATAADGIATLAEAHNDLLAKLRTSGVLDT